MNTASVADVKARLNSYIEASENAPVVITRNGKAVAAIVAIADEDDVERLLLSHSPKLRAILSSARKRLDAGRGIPHEQFWAEVERSNRQNPKRRSSK